MRHAVPALWLLIIPAAALGQSGKLPAAIQAAVDESKKVCGETAKVGDGFVAERDINGDGVKDYVLNYEHFECEGSASYFCGTGGCLTQVFASLPNGFYVKVLDENV